MGTRLNVISYVPWDEMGYTKMVKNLTGSAKMTFFSKSAWFLKSNESPRTLFFLP